MTFIRMVADAVIKEGGGSADTLVPLLHGQGFTRTQIISALSNAKRKGWLTSDKTRARRGKPRLGSKVAMYYPATNAMDLVAANLAAWSLQAKRHSPGALVASVFELGTPKPPSAWPKPPEAQAIYRPLGGWNNEEESCT